MFMARLRHFIERIAGRVVRHESSLQEAPPTPQPYNEGGLWTIHNHDFMDDAAYLTAYARGVEAVGKDYNWHWRIHVGLWAAKCANKLPGDFVECGVNRGFMSSAIMNYLSWNSVGRHYYLLDTFAGIDERFVLEAERQSGILEKAKLHLASGVYTNNVALVRQNFSEWQNVHIIEGAIPETLSQVDTENVAFLHLDMNCAPPEVAAAEYFWDRLVPGAFILLDDYAFHSFEHQKAAMDDFAARHNVSILSLPTGQGLMIKPPELK